MPRNWSEAASEGNGPVPRQDEFGPDQPTLVDVYRRFEECFGTQLKIIKSCFGQQEKKLDQLMDEMRGTRQRVASLE